MRLHAELNGPDLAADGAGAGADVSEQPAAAAAATQPQAADVNPQKGLRAAAAPATPAEGGIASDTAEEETGAGGGGSQSGRARKTKARATYASMCRFLPRPNRYELCFLTSNTLPLLCEAVAVCLCRSLCDVSSILNGTNAY
jgi:hypothetical protein